jgi:osmotically inducible protein OsmC
MFCNGIEFCCHSSWFYSRILHVEAKVALDAVDDGFEISVIKLHLTGEVSGMTEAQFNELAEKQ